MALTDGLEDVLFNISEREDAEEGMSTGKREHVYWELGTVTSDFTVLLDNDTEPLPATTSSLTPLIPGSRVYVDRQGTYIRVTGALSQGSRLVVGVSADTLIQPGSVFIPDAFMASPTYGLPNVGSPGWLEVVGDGLSVLQRYTLQGSNKVYSRQFSDGIWTIWRESGSAPVRGDLTLLSPWSAYTPASSWGVPEYRLEGDVVHLSGAVNGGTTGTSSEPITTLPVEARPSRHRILVTAANTGILQVQVTPTGSVYLRGTFTGGWVSLSGLSFLV